MEEDVELMRLLRIEALGRREQEIPEVPDTPHLHRVS